MKIALIIPYFGKLPKWSDLFFYSVMKNKELDFFIFTDADIDERYVAIPNVIFKKTSWTEYCDKVSRKLGVSFHPAKAYKLCDLRPFYGYVYMNMLRRYDYWGFCDIDLVFGNISGYVREKVAAGCEVISTHTDRVSGHFCLFRNNEKFRQLPFKITHWQNKLCDSINVGMDEIDLTRILIPEHYYVSKAAYLTYKAFSKKKNLFDKREKPFAFMLKCHKFLFRLFPRPRYSFQEMFTTHCTIPNSVWRAKKPETYWLFKDGLITAMPTRRNLIYLHFLFLKNTPFLPDAECWDETTFYRLPENKALSYFDGKEVRIDATGITMQN